FFKSVSMWRPARAWSGGMGVTVALPASFGIWGGDGMSHATASSSTSATIPPRNAKRSAARALSQAGTRRMGRRVAQRDRLEAERIDREQARAPRDRLFGCCDGEDCGKDRPDARCPAERKGEPHRIGAPQPDRLRHLHSLFAKQHPDAEDAEEMQPHDGDGDA